MSVIVIRHCFVEKMTPTNKRYSGDNRLIRFERCGIDDLVWHLDVGSSHPGDETVPKGSVVHRLKRYVSWVQNVVRQFGPYLPCRFELRRH